MKRELALRLLQSTIPDITNEEKMVTLFRELQFLADYKYNKYEMYHPGRLFLENLYLWLQQFEESERNEALRFVMEDLIFISRQEFQQLAGVLYHERIRKRQLKLAGRIAGTPTYKTRLIRDSDIFKTISRSSLYVGMSDGARIDYIRRQNLEISNEQVLPYYAISGDKINELLVDLRKSLSDQNALFQCLFLIDDFCGSGKTFLREDMLVDDDATKRVVLKGSFKKAWNTLKPLLSPQVEVFYCPLLTTRHALDRLQPLLAKYEGQLHKIEILPGAIIENEVKINSAEMPIGVLCDKYYSDELGDLHTGNVKFGLEGCGLPLILHHNTPNNSIYLLWARKKEGFSPLFVRFERHGREGV